MEFTVYGVLKNGNENVSQAKSIVLQCLINNQDSIVKIDKTSFNPDPCLGYTKHFAAQITRNSGAFYYACEDSQTIDFRYSGIPA